MIVTADVTQHLIDTSERGSCYTCPIAKAITAATGMNASAGPSYLILHRTDTPNLYAPTPDHVEDWMYRHDQWEKVAPFSFTVEFK